MPRCGASKLDGTPCDRIVGPSQRYCYAHDPARAEERRRAAAKAGRSRANPEIREIKGHLKALYEAVLEGSVERQAAAVAGQVANAWLRALELDRRFREQDNLEQRLDELEALLEEAESKTPARARW
jgi:hypothetical protein